MSSYQQIGSENPSPFSHLLAFQNEELALNRFQKDIERTYSSAEGDTKRIAAELGPDLLKCIKQFYQQDTFSIFPKLHCDPTTKTLDSQNINDVAHNLAYHLKNTDQNLSLLFARIFCAVDPVFFPKPQATRQFILETTLEKVPEIPLSPCLQFAPSIFELFQTAAYLGRRSLSVSAMKDENCCSCILQ